LLAVAILLVVSVITFVYFLNFVPDTDIVRMQLLTLVSFFKKKKNEKKNVRLGQVRCAGAHPLSQAFKPAIVNPYGIRHGRPHSDQRL